MDILRFGLDLNGQALFAPLDENVLREALVEGLELNFEELASLTNTTLRCTSFRGEIERQVVDPGDPRVAGWTWLVNANDPRRAEYARVLQDLAVHRGMKELGKPLLYAGEPPDEWLTDRFFALELEDRQVPQYVLIAGEPQQVPFYLQSILHTVACVGRVDLDAAGFEAYVRKVIRLESNPDPVVSRTSILFAPDGGIKDPTYFSREYMVQPIAEHIRDKVGLATQEILGLFATKCALIDSLSSARPALVYTASHGLGAIGQPDATQQRYNGAICCQHSGTLKQSDLFSADDVPMDRPFLEGAVFFQFGCFGYGTPAESDYTHWLKDVPTRYTGVDFVAALPKQLLAHPQGPIAYIGHLDTAFLHGFANPDEPFIVDRWHTRIAPFVHAVNHLLRVQTSGLAMEAMAKKYSVCNSILANTYDRQKRGRLKWTPALDHRFLDTWITRNDAQNYMIYGDPGARLRIPERD